MSRPFYALFSQKQYRERSINSHAKEVPGNKRYIPACTVSEFLHVKILANKHCRGKSEILKRFLKHFQFLLLNGNLHDEGNPLATHWEAEIVFVIFCIVF